MDVTACSNKSKITAQLMKTLQLLGDFVPRAATEVPPQTQLKTFLHPDPLTNPLPNPGTWILPLVAWGVYTITERI